MIAEFGCHVNYLIAERDLSLKNFLGPDVVTMVESLKAVLVTMLVDGLHGPFKFTLSSKE